MTREREQPVERLAHGGPAAPPAHAAARRPGPVAPGWAHGWDRGGTREYGPGGRA